MLLYVSLQHKGFYLYPETYCHEHSKVAFVQRQLCIVRYMYFMLHSTYLLNNWSTQIETLSSSVEFGLGSSQLWSPCSVTLSAGVFAKSPPSPCQSRALLLKTQPFALHRTYLSPEDGNRFISLSFLKDHS